MTTTTYDMERTTALPIVASMGASSVARTSRTRGIDLGCGTGTLFVTQDDQSATATNGYAPRPLGSTSTST